MRGSDLTFSRCGDLNFFNLWRFRHGYHDVAINLADYLRPGEQTAIGLTEWKGPPLYALCLQQLLKVKAVCFRQLS